MTTNKFDPINLYFLAEEAAELRLKGDHRSVNSFCMKYAHGALKSAIKYTKMRETEEDIKNLKAKGIGIYMSEFYRNVRHNVKVMTPGTSEFYTNIRLKKACETFGYN